MQYRPSQPDAARLDFATVAAYEETTSQGGPYHQRFAKRRQAFEDRIAATGGKVKDAYFVMQESREPPVVYSAGGECAMSSAM